MRSTSLSLRVVLDGWALVDDGEDGEMLERGRWVRLGLSLELW